MRAIISLLVAFLVVCLVWGLVKALLASLLGLAFQIALIAFFCWLVYAVFRALNRDRI